MKSKQLTAVLLTNNPFTAAQRFQLSFQSQVGPEGIGTVTVVAAPKGVGPVRAAVRFRGQTTTKSKWFCPEHGSAVLKGKRVKYEATIRLVFFLVWDEQGQRFVMVSSHNMRCSMALLVYHLRE